MKTIVIDPGHGGSDPGAVNAGRLEKNDNLRMALAVRDRLVAAGQNVILTRTGDTYVSLLQRSVIANNAGADLFISLHRNASINPEANGVENYIQLGAQPPRYQYAANVLGRVVAAGVQSNRGVKEGDYSVLRNTVPPAQLLELGFITNSVDNVLFDTNFNAYADAIAQGILSSLGETGQPAPAPPPSPAPPSGAVNPAQIKSIQQVLNSRYNAGLSVDGVVGPKTLLAIRKGVQTELNRIFGANLAVDGVIGEKTKAAFPNLRRGSKNNLVYLMQAMLYIKGYGTIPDGIFGPATESGVIAFQRANGLTPDGIAGKETLYRLFK